MLSIKAIKNSGATSKYFSQADYYTSDQDNGVASAWAGQGAEALGLSGAVGKSQLTIILDGLLPNGVQLGRIGKDGAIEHQKGWDLTLSAPKSVSIMALVAGDDRLLGAHADAVAATMSLVETQYATTRRMENGERLIEKTGSLVIAQFRHTTSRALDPQLHTHNLVMNATERGDGEWASIESKNIYNNSKLIGTIYRNELARRVTELGYQIDINAQKGFFEIAGIPESVRKGFSKRRAEVEAAIKEHGYSTARGFDQAAVRSRDAKQRMSEGGLKERWEAELKQLGYSREDLIASTNRAQSPSVTKEQEDEPQRQPTPESVPADTPNSPAMPQPNSDRNHGTEHTGGDDKPNDVQATERTQETSQPSAAENPRTSSNPVVDKQPDLREKTSADDIQDPTPVKKQHGLKSKSALEDVLFTVRNLAEREATFTESILITKTLGWSLGSHTSTDIDSAIQTLVKRGELIPATLDDNPAFTTRVALDQEQRLIKLAAGGKRSVKPVVSAKYVGEALADSGLNAGQQSAARLILSTRDRFVGVQGLAGTGKTFMLGKVREIAEQKGFVLRGMAPTGAAAEQLASESGINSQTVASHLAALRAGRDDVQRKEIWIVDESSLNNTDDMLELAQFAKDKSARIVLVGDTKQIGAISAGRPFGQLMKSGMQFAEMSEIRRQSENPSLLAAVYDSINKAPDLALSKIKDTVYSIKNNDERIKAIVDHYMSLALKDRADMLVLIPDNETRKEVNRLIQERARAEGTVSESEVSHRILVSQGLTDVEKTRADFYRPGSFVRFGNDYKRLGVEKDEYLKVLRVEGSILTLQRENGRSIKWNPSTVAGGRQGKSPGVETYIEEDRSLGKGDLIRWKQTDRDRGLKNGYLGTITAIDGDQATINFQKKGEMTLNLKDNRHWDLGYATTIFSAQGATYKNVIVHTESWRRNLINLKTFYVGISRAKRNAFVYTDNAAELGIKVKSRHGEKTSAIESAGIPYKKILDDKGLIIDSRVKDAVDQINRVRDKAVDAIKTTFRIGMDI